MYPSMTVMNKKNPYVVCEFRLKTSVPDKRGISGQKPEKADHLI